MHDLHSLEEKFIGWGLWCDDGTMEVTKETETIDDDAKLVVENDSIESDKNVAKEEMVNKSEDNKLIVDEKKRKILIDDDERKRRKISRDKMSRVACEDEGCERTFKSKGNLQKHLGKKILVVCERCGTKLKGDIQLSIHLKKIHNHIRKFACKTCNMEFAGVSSLKSHEVKHDSTIAGGKFKCDFCTMFLTQKVGLKRHIRAVHNK